MDSCVEFSWLLHCAMISIVATKERQWHNDKAASPEHHKPRYMKEKSSRWIPFAASSSSLYTRACASAADFCCRVQRRRLWYLSYPLTECWDCSCPVCVCVNYRHKMSSRTNGQKAWIFFFTFGRPVALPKSNVLNVDMKIYIEVSSLIIFVVMGR